ncbi:energy-coupling factor ABC transporter ATP-binding protein [Pseudooceanicola sp. 502str34]
MTLLVDADALTVHRDGRPVLREAGLALAPGERLAIVGPNGAGKTTLLRALVGLEPLAGGRLTLFGSPCRREAEFRVARRRIGFLFQDSDDQLFCPTVLEDVAFGPLNLGQSRAEAEATARAALEGLGLLHLAERLTHKLSGGEKRLVCLAGLFAMAPDVILLDEPTNGVDAANGARFEAALSGFAGAMILVSHDDGFVTRMATRGMLLEEGRLVPAEIHSHRHSHAHPHMHRAHGASD